MTWAIVMMSGAPRIILIQRGGMMTVQDEVMALGIRSDAAYAGRFMHDLTHSRAAEHSNILAFCMAPYLSLFVHESYRKRKIIDPKLPQLLSTDVEAIVARSRNSLKLFEDNQRGVEGQLTFFRDKISSVHADMFLGNTWLRIARFLEVDLGLYSYEERIISTTHAAVFHLGFDPLVMPAEVRRLKLQAIYEEYGRYFRGLGAGTDSGAQTFMSNLDPKRFDRYPNDVRSAKYYSQVFNGRGTPDINRLLMVFRGLMNFIDSVVGLGTDANKVEYTVFKIRFLTLYQVLGSLQLLQDELPGDLTARSTRLIKKITDTSSASLIMDRSAKPFRNTLMHYNLDSRVDLARVDVTQPLFGLVPIFFPSHDAESFIEAVDSCIEETTSVMEEWAALP
ncbi:hypothetical protein [Streptomyces sp. NPDC057554]|uniref:hypothetical protein n=1 Tax=Streptomyces sp. NPDC057554 TaxID=3350538 RepID=UPI00369383AC